MNRSQLEPIIRAAGDIAGDDEIIILGSTAVLSQFPALPEQFIRPMEADIFPKNKPDPVDHGAVFPPYIIQNRLAITRLIITQTQDNQGWSIWMSLLNP